MGSKLDVNSSTFILNPFFIKYRVSELLNQEGQKVKLEKMMKMSFIQVKRPYKRRTPKELWSKTTKRSKKVKDKKEIVEKPKKLPDNSLGQLAKQFIGLAA